MRQWRPPERLVDQQDIAPKRGYAWVWDYKQHKKVRVNWRNTYRVEDEWQKLSFVELEIDGQKHWFDKEELTHWFRYA